MYDPTLAHCWATVCDAGPNSVPIYDQHLVLLCFYVAFHVILHVIMSSIPDILIKNNKKITDRKHIANSFNDFL